MRNTRLTGLVLCACAFGASASRAGDALLNWAPPTQNSDGSSLTDLAGYRVYRGTSAQSLSTLIDIANPGTTSYVVSGLTTGTYFFAISSYRRGGQESALSAVRSKTIAAQSPVPVNCAVSAWSAWAATGNWNACSGGSQSRSEKRTRTVTTQAANGGTACPALTETRTATQSCSSPASPPPGTGTAPAYCAYLKSNPSLASYYKANCT